MIDKKLRDSQSKIKHNHQCPYRCERGCIEIVLDCDRKIVLDKIRFSAVMKGLRTMMPHWSHYSDEHIIKIINHVKDDPCKLSLAVKIKAIEKAVEHALVDARQIYY